MFQKNWVDPPLDEEKSSDPPLEKIRSALTDYKNLWIPPP